MESFLYVTELLVDVKKLPSRVTVLVPEQRIRKIMTLLRHGVVEPTTRLDIYSYTQSFVILCVLKKKKKKKKNLKVL